MSAAAIIELTPCEAHERQRSGALLVDVRDDGERAAGMAEAALGVSRARLENDPAAWLPDPAAAIMLICAAGMRSMQCAKVLHGRGYTHLYSVSGGTKAWQAAGLPMTEPTADLDFLERYSRHLRLSEIGLEGQRKLAAARVALIGAGGLGSPAALYLAAAGIGRLTVIDDDVVDRSNLQRQVLHRDADVGTLKVESAGRTLRALNPHVVIELQRTRLLAANVERLLGGHDVVIDGSDNFSTRYLVNDACVRLGVPMVYGAVQGFDGQVSVFWPTHEGGSCYRCLFPEPPAPEFAPNCSEAGVLGVLPGVIGLLQATEAIKLILDIGESLSGTLLQFDALGMQFNRLRLARDPHCPRCGAGVTAADYVDLPAACAAH
ncbi:molybdopterin-synthase adenylyltransferase MoeB [Paraburkholderia phenazinium]|uniref:Molybdopterin-synthase adenylyltransferase n=1 Tax=Paraburkholderia phenazinium TaxID=60549 RepID=A0A1G8N182_9BURK|nr:molybdopterin-synthase adenylyltransferase MoeB [Paraburkholderia phenazinium]SDI73948.1 Molybdopterin or thiamine biosynthesis adenylyltransferase [Paraburkholderia phenazinium]